LWTKDSKPDFCVTAALRAGLAAMGLELFGDPRHRLPMITAVVIPAGVEDEPARQRLLDEYGIEIAASFGPLRGRVWRIGVMGVNATLPVVLSVLGGLERVACDRGVGAQRGAGVDAACEIFAQPVAP
jgi:(S)-ureidoglycine-glyoxylate aminotransferase